MSKVGKWESGKVGKWNSLTGAGRGAADNYFILGQLLDYFLFLT